MKVDLAVQSYKKIESLVYTLLSIKKYCNHHIETVYINDDCSGNDLSLFESGWLKDLFPNWKIKTRYNSMPVGTGTIFLKDYKPHYLIGDEKPNKTALTKIKNFIKKTFRMVGLMNVPQGYTIEDIRYQWGIESTDKKWLFICHDDLKLTGDVIGLYLEKANDQIGLIGELGQCWNCEFCTKCSKYLFILDTFFFA